MTKEEWAEDAREINKMNWPWYDEVDKEEARMGTQRDREANVGSSGTVEELTVEHFSAADALQSARQRITELEAALNDAISTLTLIANGKSTAPTSLAANTLKTLTEKP